MKLFLAFPLPDPVRQALAETSEPLRTAIIRQGVRFVKPEKWHATAMYIGDVEKVEELQAELRNFFAAHTELKSLAMKMKSFGGFPGLQRPKVVFAEIEADFQSFYWELATAFESWCTTRPDPEWQGHVTLARVSPGSKIVGHIVRDKARLVPSVTEWTTTEVVLMESMPEGSYREIETYRFGGN